jgi:hypothetical protein
MFLVWNNGTIRTDGNLLQVYALMLARGRTPWSFSMSYAFSYYGAETIGAATEGMIDPFVQRSSPKDAAARQRAVMRVVAGTDQIGAIVKEIGGHLELVYKVDNLSPIPKRLAELVRRVA